MTNREALAIREIGRYKDEIRNLVNNGGLNSKYDLGYIEYCIKMIKMYKQIRDAEQDSESALEQFGQYIREWDHDRGDLTEEEGTFYQFGQPTEAYKNKMKEKARHEKHRKRKG